MSNYFWNPDIFWQHAISYGLYLAMFNFFPQNMATLCSFSPNDLCWIHNPFHLLPSGHISPQKEQYGTGVFRFNFVISKIW
jgi:hypothetical protein